MRDLDFSHDCVGPRIPNMPPEVRELIELDEYFFEMIRGVYVNMLREDMKKDDEEIRSMFNIAVDVTDLLHEAGKDQMYNLIQEGYIHLGDYFYQEVNGEKVKITICDIYDGKVKCFIDPITCIPLMNQEATTTEMEIQRLNTLSANFRKYQIPERNLNDIEELMIPYDVTKVHFSRRKLKPIQKITLH